MDIIEFTLYIDSIPDFDDLYIETVVEIEVEL